MNVLKLESKDKNRSIKFIRDIIDLSRVDDKTGEDIQDYRIVIKLKNFDNNRSRVHLYTDFLGKWRNSKPKSAYDIALYIVQFLNYIYFELSFKELSSIQELTFVHGIEYLELYCERRVARSTIKHCDDALKEFFYFLTQKNILNHIALSDFIFIEDKNGKARLQSPFKGKYKLPKNETKPKLHQILEELVLMFLLTSLEVVPQIALGVYFQIFGGLRYSEVVNLRYSCIHKKGPYGRNGMVLEIKKTRQRPDLKVDAITSPKKERNQPIFAISDLLSNLYSNHIRNYKKINVEAVFMDSNGNPMSRGTYSRNFNKLKDAFILKLKNSSDPKVKLYSSFLQQENWSTHIGRGIFSAMVADSAKNALEIAILRGDSDLRSALAYLSDSKRVETKVVINMNNFYEDSIKRDFSSLF